MSKRYYVNFRDNALPLYDVIFKMGLYGKISYY